MTQDDARGVAEARVRFLTDSPFDRSQVRDSILASWWRSQQLEVAADRIDMPYVRDPDLDTPLTRSADPVLRHLLAQLGGQALSVVLTDATGVVLTRLTADKTLERHLDRVQLAPGFSYAEQYVGTNGIGTALEGGGPMHVFGHEHYAEHLEDLACAGVPIRHALTGKTVGVLDLTCWRRDAGPLLLTLAKTTADQVGQALMTESGLREMELLHEYLRACRRSSGMVFALNNDVVMMNEVARATLSPQDQPALLRRASEATSPTGEGVTLELPSGATVRMTMRRVCGDGRIAGVVAHVRAIEAGSSRAPVPRGPQMLLPGLVGTGALWRRACEELLSAFATDDWLVVEGEQGVGKLALARAVHQRLVPAERFCVVDAAQGGEPGWLQRARAELAGEGGTVVVRHLERLDEVTTRSLTAALQDAVRRRGVRVLLATRAPVPATGADGLAQLFPQTVVVPPLRHHVEDVHQLVPFLLMRLGHGGRLSCSPGAMKLLQRSSWPGNVEQLLQALRAVTLVRRAGTIEPHDLPPDLGTTARHLLSPLESMERDAIVRSLADEHGNKASAARALGMSRATIYRKIREYGVSVGVDG